MIISVDDNTGDLLTSMLPNWEQINEKIQESFAQNRYLVKSHLAVRMRLESSFFHLSLLDSLYNLESSRAIVFLIGTTFENIVFHLAGTLDSIAHVINNLYKFEIDIKRVQIDHAGREHSIPQKQKYCARCKLNIVNDDLAAYLNLELPQSPMPENHWYRAFSEYRNHVVHRILYSPTLTNWGGIYLPDDPTNLNPHSPLTAAQKKYLEDHADEDIILHPSYSQKREIREYSQFCFDEVLSIVEKVYNRLLLKI